MDHVDGVPGVPDIPGIPGVVPPGTRRPLVQPLEAVRQPEQLDAPLREIAPVAQTESLRGLPHPLPQSPLRALRAGRHEGALGGHHAHRVVEDEFQRAVLARALVQRPEAVAPAARRRMRDRGLAAEEGFEQTEQGAGADRGRKVGEPAEQLGPLVRTQRPAGPGTQLTLDVGPGAAIGVGMPLPVPVVAVVGMEDRLVHVVVLGPHPVRRDGQGP